RTRDRRALRAGTRRRSRGALPQPPPRILDGAAGATDEPARVRGVGARSQPRTPRAHRTCGHRLRLASVDTAGVQPAGAARPAAPSRRVVGLGPGSLLPARHVVATHDAYRAAAAP